MYAGKAFHTREPAAEKLVSLKLMRVRGTTQTEAGCGQCTITHNWKRWWRWCWCDCVSSASRNYLRFLTELPANETMTIGLITALLWYASEVHALGVDDRVGNESLQEDIISNPNGDTSYEHWKILQIFTASNFILSGISTVEYSLSVWHWFSFIITAMIARSWIADLTSVSALGQNGRNVRWSRSSEETDRGTDTIPMLYVFRSGRGRRNYASKRLIVVWLVRMDWRTLSFRCKNAVCMSTQFSDRW